MESAGVREAWLSAGFVLAIAMGGRSVAGWLVAAGADRVGVGVGPPHDTTMAATSPRPRHRLAIRHWYTGAA